MLASRRYVFVELWLSTPEALYAIGVLVTVLVTVADGSRRDEGGVVSAGRGLDVGEGSCMLPLESCSTAEEIAQKITKHT